MQAHRSDPGSYLGSRKPGARGPASLLAVLALVGGCTRGTEERGIGDVASELRVCPSASTVPGIDVSVYQGRIDWDRVASSGIGFGIARIGDGLVRDDATFDANWSGIKAAGLVRGAYQYFEASEDPEAEADRVVAKVGPLGPGDLPVALDLEAADGEPADEILRRAEIWIARVTLGTGKPPLVYTAKYFWDGIPGGGALGSLPLWVAHFGVACPDLPSAWDRWRLWQNGDTSTIPGVSASVDHDVFDGTLNELRAFAGVSPSVRGAGDASATDSAVRRMNASMAEPVRDGSASPSNAGARTPGATSAVGVDGPNDATRTPRSSPATPSDAHDLGADARAPSPSPDDAHRASWVSESDGASLSPCDSQHGESASADPDAGCACHVARPERRGGSGASAALLVLAIVVLGRGPRRSAGRRSNAAHGRRARATLPV